MFPSHDQRGVNERIHGIYSPDDYNAAQRRLVGRAAFQHRKWAIPGFQRRWEAQRFDERLEATVEGNYRTFGRFSRELLPNLVKFKVDLMAADWKALEDWEKENIRRTMAELIYTAMAVTLGYVLTTATDRDWETSQDPSYSTNQP